MLRLDGMRPLHSSRRHIEQVLWRRLLSWASDPMGGVLVREARRCSESSLLIWCRVMMKRMMFVEGVL